MKIFNWVHRRFHHIDEAGQEANKQAEFIGKENDTLALLEDATLAGVFDSWKEGILTIGTLGFDPFKGFKHEEQDYMYVIDPDEEIGMENEETIDGDDDKESDQEAEMEHPLMSKAFKHGFYHDQKDEISQCDREVAKPNAQEHGDEVDLGVDQVNKVRRSGERITLADLFWADSGKNMWNKDQKKLANDQVQIHCHRTTSTKSIKKQSTDNDKVSFSKKKKLTKEDLAHPIKKINRLMRKMLKRKIHPDMESYKKEIAEKTSTIGMLGSAVNI